MLNQYYGYTGQECPIQTSNVVISLELQIVTKRLRYFTCISAHVTSTQRVTVSSICSREITSKRIPAGPVSISVTRVSGFFSKYPLVLTLAVEIVYMNPNEKRTIKRETNLTVR